MSRKGKVYIIDNNAKRADRLSTLFDFIGEFPKVSNYSSENDVLDSVPEIILLGAAESIDKTLAELDHLTTHYPDVPIIVVGDKLGSEQCLGRNVVSCLPFPFDYSQILEALHQCQRARATIAALIPGTATALTPMFRNLGGSSAAIHTINKLIGQVANTDATVLILGESGSGKEIIARNIHALSSRVNKPFVPINCGAIPAELLESELFGHEKGAFTGAITARSGRFELAHGGTLFLDEIGDMPLTMQVKLLRVLQERCFERVGSNKSVVINVRIIAATHRNLEAAIDEGKFREDLFYRLNVFPIEMPPLRSRKEDIPFLFNEFISQMKLQGRPLVRLTPDAMSALTNYSWPGNVRELANLVERLTILYPNSIVSKENLPPLMRENYKSSAVMEGDVLAHIMWQDPSPSVIPRGINLKEHLEKTELTLIRQALFESNWVVARAANYLSMRRTTLVEKMRKYGLTRPELVEN